MGQEGTDYASAIGRKFPEQVVIALAKDLQVVAIVPRVLGHSPRLPNA